MDLPLSLVRVWVLLLVSLAHMALSRLSRLVHLFQCLLIKEFVRLLRLLLRGRVLLLLVVVVPVP